MMYPRLKLLHELLSVRGGMFISIDDNELTNLVAVMNDIFGERNAVGIVVIQNNPRGRHLDEYLAKTHE
jgi:adenine-specific DNA-methyltransferase